MPDQSDACPLGNSNQLLRSVVSGLPLVLWAVDWEGRFVLSEGAGLEALGLRPGEVVGRSVFDVYAGVPEICENVRRALAGEAFTATVRVGDRVFETQYLPGKSKNGAVHGVVGISQDVTERWRAEEALRESEEKFRTLVETSPDAIFSTGLDDRFISVNPATEQLLGYSRDELVGMEVSRIIAPEHMELADAMTQAKLQEGGRTVYELEVVRKDGRRVPLEVSSWLLYENGQPVAVQGIARDISERKRVEQALRESEERYREIFDNATDIIYTHDLAGRFTSINRAAERITGYTREEAIGKSVADVVAPEYLAMSIEMGRRKLREGGTTTYELEIITKEGRRVPLEVSTRIIYQDGQPVGVQGVARDISERKRAEDAVKRREEVLKGLSYAARHFLTKGIDDRAGMDAVLERLGLAAEVSRAYVFENREGPDGQLLACQRFEWAAPGVEPQIDNPDLAAFPYVEGGFGRWVDIMSEGGIICGHVRDFPPAEQEVLGAQGILSILCIPVFVDGRWWGFVGLDQCEAEREWSDASIEALKTAADLLGAAIQRQRRDQALRESEERYRELVENSNEVIYTLDKTGIITYVSPVVEQMGGYKPEEVVGRSFVPLVHPDDLPGLMESFQRTLAGHLEPSEYRLRTKWGEYRWVRSHSRPVLENGQVAGLRGMLIDITERKRAEDALRAVAQGAASGTGEGFFRSLVRHLASAAGVKYALVGELLPEDPERAQTLAVWADGDFGENFTYELAGTPCQRALQTSAVFYPKGVRELFPQDALGAEMGVEAYMGTGLYDSQGSPLGILALMHDQPLEDAPGNVSLMSIFAARAAAELERRRAEMLLAGQAQVLEKIAKGEPLEDILADVIRVVEKQADGMLGSVLLMDPSGRKLIPCAAPSLPEAYNEGLRDGVDVGPVAGSCGTAAFRKEQVVVTDIATDRLWENYRDLALAHGLRACWSTPIISSAGQVLGTFALYYRRPRSPDQRIQKLIAAAAHIAGIAIERRRDEELIKASEERYRTVVNAARDVIYTLAPDGTLTSLNPAFEEITGWECVQWVGKPFMPLIHPEDLSRALGEMKNLLGGQPGRFELRVLTKSGDYVVGEFTATPLVRGGRIEGVLGIARDITERRKAEETIRRLAYHDALTGLPNRALFEDRLSVALAQAHRNKQMLAVMFLDLDRFKLVNDTLGHGHGDLLLKSVARDLTQLVREGDTVARVGGDEFTILLADIGSAEAATAVAERILDRLKRPRVVEGHELRVTTSIGISLYPTDGSDAETLLRNADTAMYRAKEQGRDNYQCFAPAMNAGVVQRLTLERELREALEREEYVVYYQPVANMASGEVTGCEALLRWRHPRSGLVLPGEFIEVAEEIGLLLPLGEWVLRTACKQAKAWQEAGFAPVRMSVNLSARQIQDGCLVETVRQALEDAGLDPALLELEITESAVMTNVEATAAMLQELKAMGVGIAVDDFGTGYSSLSYLKQFPIDTVKIDGSFVRDIATDPNDAAIVTTIIAMAKSLKVRVIAEGVETAQQLEFLRERGCDEYQGFILSKAVPAETFRRLLSRPGSRNGRRHVRAAGVAGSRTRA